MQKTFKKAFACLLAILMLLCSMPFTAFAATQWWVDAGIENAANTVKAEPTYTGWADDGFELAFGTDIDLTLPDYEGIPTHNADFKPIIAVTVSSIGDSTYTKAQNKTAKTQFYSANTTNTYSVVKAAGNILDPTDIKAGQRVAITLEIGGFDVLRIGQFKGTYDTNLLTAGSFNAMTNAWSAITKPSATPAIGKADTLYSGVVAKGASIDPELGTFYVASETSGASAGKASTYIANRPFGQYGVVVCTFAFQAKSDCDLTTAFQFNNETYFMTYDPAVVGTACNIGIGEGDEIFANPLIIWPDVKDSSATRNYDVTIKPWQTSAGTVTIDGEEVTSSTGVTKKVAENETVALVATENAGYKFLGWKANDGTTVSTQREINPLVNANITYTPIFAPAPASNEIVLTFEDAFENIVGVYTITKGDTSFVAPKVPDRAGYTANGWSVTDFAALTEDTVVTPIYTKITATNYTVEVPDGSTIAVGNGAPQSVKSVSVPYNTQVTVYNASAKSWKINGATVAYGDTYTFYVGANVVLTIDETPVTVQTPVVGSVNIDVSADGKRVSFLATRKIDTAEGWVQVNAGFMYGTTGVTASTELVDVNGTSVKAVYTKTDAEQFSISFNVTSGKTYNGRAFITYKNAADEINVAYANLQTYNA